MPATSYHAPTGQWLTSFGPNCEPGSEHTISIGHPLKGGEFTTFKLGPVVAVDQFGHNLFDLNNALAHFAGAFFPYLMLVGIAKNWRIDKFELRGRTFERGHFGNFHERD